MLANLATRSTITLLGVNALCTILQLAFALSPSPRIFESGVFDACLLVNAVCWILAIAILSAQGWTNSRLAHNRKTFDVFLSYRQVPYTTEDCGR